MLEFLQSRLVDGLLPYKVQRDAADLFGTAFFQVERLALENNILPARYIRNQNIISTTDQLLLHRSRVAVIGCGGLGGHVIEQLARMGVGTIVAVDPDVFEEHNLNRQLFSTPSAIGLAKVDAALSRVNEINPAVTLIPQQTSFSLDNGSELLNGCLAAVDALDSITARLELSNIAEIMQIPLIHGAIAGWYGQISTQLPGDNTLQRIYSNRTAKKGIEAKLGNPSFTPALVASLQAAEVCKVLLGKGNLLRQRILSIDLLGMDIQEIRFEGVPEI
jgi:molybdopterin-synthase adenylyltransferase